MDRKIHKIRKSIKARNKIRQLQNESDGFPNSYTLTDEEKYSAYPEIFYNDRSNRKGEMTPFFKNTSFYKILASLALFIFSLILLKTNIIPFEKPKELLQNALKEDLPFATIYDWYVQHLGVPLSLVPTEAPAQTAINNEFNIPITGEVVESFSTNGAGIMISPESKDFVRAMNNGIVIFAGSKNDTDKTIIIQHPDRSESTYGMLSSIDVHLYQMVDANQVIGTKIPTEESRMVFFSIEKANHYIDPAKVIRVDGNP